MHARCFEINPIILKLKGELNMLKMYPHTGNEAASLRRSKRIAWIGKKYENMSQGQGQSQNFKSSELLRALS